MQYVKIMDVQTVIKQNEMMPFVATWMDVETVILNEVSPTEKDVSYDITCVWNLKR